ncbi:peptidyl-tRNA hydrolase II domain-containing protein [Baffinella frigidus]|nr:peptidyl-tRNA hydrolase II domain-containing protein [Cryptophyta sp. CCMP2293]
MADAEKQYADTMVQYVVLRKDLLKAPHNWNLGSMVAQGCHIVTKLLWELKEEDNVVKYMSDMDNMHKVTLGAKDEAELSGLEEQLKEAGIECRAWREQPENVITALATMPYPRSEIAPHMKALKLLR